MITTVVFLIHGGRPDPEVLPLNPGSTKHLVISKIFSIFCSLVISLSTGELPGHLKLLLWLWLWLLPWSWFFL